MKLVLFVFLFLKSNSDQETLKSSLGAGFSVTSPHVTQLLGQQQQLFPEMQFTLDLGCCWGRNARKAGSVFAIGRLQKQML